MDNDILTTATGREIPVSSVLCDETASLLYIITHGLTYGQAVEIFVNNPTETAVLENGVTRYEGFTQFRGVVAHGVGGIRINMGAE